MFLQTRRVTGSEGFIYSLALDETREIAFYSKYMGDREVIEYIIRYW